MTTITQADRDAVDAWKAFNPNRADAADFFAAELREAKEALAESKKENAELKAMPYASDRARAIAYGDKIDALRAENEELRKGVVALRAATAAVLRHEEWHAAVADEVTPEARAAIVQARDALINTARLVTKEPDQLGNGQEGGA